MTTPMMTCGHAANATSNGSPACAICGTVTVATEAPDLTGREARCYCGSVASSEKREYLAFFSHRPGAEFDEYYCGCRGWD